MACAQPQLVACDGGAVAVAPLLLVGAVDDLGCGAGSRALGALAAGGDASARALQLAAAGTDGAGAASCDATLLTVAGEDGQPRVSLLRVLRADAACEPSTAARLAAAAAALAAAGGARDTVVLATARIAHKAGRAGGVWTVGGDERFAPRLSEGVQAALGAAAAGALPSDASLSDGFAAAFAHHAAVHALPCALALCHAERNGDPPRALALAAAQLAELPVDEERWADAGASPAPARAGHEDRSMVYI